MKWLEYDKEHENLHFEHVLSAEQSLYQGEGNSLSNTIPVYVLNSPELTFLMYQDYLNFLLLAPSQ